MPVFCGEFPPWTSDVFFAGFGELSCAKLKGKRSYKYPSALLELIGSSVFVNSDSNFKTSIMAPVFSSPEYDIPSHCKAGVVVNEGPDFEVRVEMVPVPEPGTPHSSQILASVETLCSSRQVRTTY